MLNHSHAWLTSFLPFILQKINRVHFGLLQPNDIVILENDGVKIPTTRKLLAVPFVGTEERYFLLYIYTIYMYTFMCLTIYQYPHNLIYSLVPR